MKRNKILFSALIVISISLVACSSDDNSPAQSTNSQPVENQELYDATKRPLDQAKAVEKIIMDKAARDREQTADQ